MPQCISTLLTCMPTAYANVSPPFTPPAWSTTSTLLPNWCPFVRQRTMPWAECAPISADRLLSPVYMPLERWRVPACTAPTGWPAIRCWKDWCTEHVLPRTCVSVCGHVVTTHRLQELRVPPHLPMDTPHRSRHSSRRCNR